MTQTPTMTKKMATIQAASSRALKVGNSKVTSPNRTR
jgi:hypothetical protein